MTKHATIAEDVDLDRFRSPIRVLARCFQRSRDNWKRKYMELKSELKRCQVRMHDMADSRQQWREKAEATERELAALQGELQERQRQVNSSGSESQKKGLSPVLAVLAP
jgi:predicted  nucleic acid-binding Zn-ribbon protein